MSGNFYKPRNYLPIEFPELLHPGGGSEHVIMDVGSGYGSSTLPLLVKNRDSRFIIFDFSETAIEMLKVFEHCVKF